MKKFLLLLSLGCMTASAAQAAVVGKELSYIVNGTTLKGYVA